MAIRSLDEELETSIVSESSLNTIKRIVRDVIRDTTTAINVQDGSLNLQAFSDALKNYLADPDNLNAQELQTLLASFGFAREAELDTLYADTDIRASAPFVFHHDNFDDTGLAIPQNGKITFVVQGVSFDVPGGASALLNLPHATTTALTGENSVEIPHAISRDRDGNYGVGLRIGRSAAGNFLLQTFDDDSNQTRDLEIKGHIEQEIVLGGATHIFLQGNNLFYTSRAGDNERRVPVDLSSLASSHTPVANSVYVNTQAELDALATSQTAIITSSFGAFLKDDILRYNATSSAWEKISSLRIAPTASEVDPLVGAVLSRHVAIAYDVAANTYTFSWSLTDLHSDLQDLINGKEDASNVYEAARKNVAALTPEQQKAFRDRIGINYPKADNAFFDFEHELGSHDVDGNAGTPFHDSGLDFPNAALSFYIKNDQDGESWDTTTNTRRYITKQELFALANAVAGSPFESQGYLRIVMRPPANAASPDPAFWDDDDEVYYVGHAGPRFLDTKDDQDDYTLRYYVKGSRLKDFADASENVKVAPSDMSLGADFVQGGDDLALSLLAKSVIQGTNVIDPNTGDVSISPAPSAANKGRQMFLDGYLYYSDSENWIRQQRADQSVSKGEESFPAKYVATAADAANLRLQAEASTGGTRDDQRLLFAAFENPVVQPSPQFPNPTRTTGSSTSRLTPSGWQRVTYYSHDNNNQNYAGRFVFTPHGDDERAFAPVILSLRLQGEAQSAETNYALNKDNHGRYVSAVVAAKYRPIALDATTMPPQPDRALLFNLQNESVDGGNYQYLSPVEGSHKYVPSELFGILWKPRDFWAANNQHFAAWRGTPANQWNVFAATGFAANHFRITDLPAGSKCVLKLRAGTTTQIWTGEFYSDDLRALPFLTATTTVPIPGREIMSGADNGSARPDANCLTATLQGFDIFRIGWYQGRLAISVDHPDRWLNTSSIAEIKLLGS